eukprot:CAMPEP_0114591334 /NCGR_PEP_ID=MMETSP0125-20121206/13397_1 /TAXON_ID=485358 ORGANISM="Aristerostoma sp., Strain ATCC 50986" /NCGR_SAMPLE_ID=MMETSP0125 /ASSEMBLY_ACC=CAM_ASM_000245 /LENGTH=166 /DNA_ID=CAMNT_0001789347 /DNA_START=232 /DNA_END=729 /DNA_ORIENTATION=-
MCPSKYIEGGNGQEGNMVKQKTCVDPFNIWDHGLIFEQESYTISLHINVPINKRTADIGVIPIKTEFINMDHEVLTHHALGSIDVDLNMGIVGTLKKKIYGYLGYHDRDIDINIVVSEQFANHNFDISVLNIEINEPKLLINQAYLKLDVELRGLRYLFYTYLYIW